MMAFSGRIFETRPRNEPRKSPPARAETNETRRAGAHPFPDQTGAADIGIVGKQSIARTTLASSAQQPL
jgi:hypothetical protein